MNNLLWTVWKITPALLLYSNCLLLFWNRFASKIKKPWKIYFFLSKFLENYLELNILKKIIHGIKEIVIQVEN